MSLLTVVLVRPHLDLGKNGLGADGATALAAPIGALTAGTALHLNDNELGADGALSLAPALGRR